MRKANLSPKHRITSVEKRDDYEKLKISVQIPMEFGWIERVKFIISTVNLNVPYQLEFKEKDEENEYAIFETEISLKTYAIYHYYFSFECNGKFRLIKKINTSEENAITKEECYKLSVGFEVPDWAKGAIMYHIFVDRFARDNSIPMKEMPKRTINKWSDKPVLGPNDEGEWNVDFYGGNLKGIEQSLDYIQSLGVNILYLSPIVQSQSNHRYDTADYENVDPYLGTNEDLHSLCNSAHKKGMKVVIDAVFNHTGNDSKYFNQFSNFETIGAYQSENSPYYKFYKRIWNSGKRYFCFWWGMQNLPECNSASKEWQDYILAEGGIVDKWFALGIDGLRLDVADELSDEYIEMIRKAVHRNKKDGFILGEVWKNPMRMNRGYLSSGKGMDSVMNYLFIDALIRYYKYQDYWKLDSVIKEIFSEYPEDTIHTLMNFTSTHDISRVIEIFGCNAFQRNGEWAWNLANDNLDWIRDHQMSSTEYEYGKKILKSFVTVLAFFPGIFSIFYGDEVGMQGIGNLANRGSFPWGKEDIELLEFFKIIGRARTENPFLKTASCKILEISKERFVFERFSDSERILAIVSRTHYKSKVNIPEGYEIEKIVFKIENSNLNELQPYGAIVVKVNTEN